MVVSASSEWITVGDCVYLPERLEYFLFIYRDNQLRFFNQKFSTTDGVHNELVYLCYLDINAATADNGE